MRAMLTIAIALMLPCAVHADEHDWWASPDTPAPDGGQAYEDMRAEDERRQQRLIDALMALGSTDCADLPTSPVYLSMGADGLMRVSCPECVQAHAFHFLDREAIKAAEEILVDNFVHVSTLLTYLGEC